MLTLNDGRSELWQWDTGRTLSVPDDCSQVHFSNKVFGRSIDVDVIDGVATVPDILLQTDKELTAWAFVGSPENGYTKISKVFKVNKRNKPADYVFTPPEQTTLGEILERLDDIESAQDPDAIKNAVEDYLEKNPVEAPVQSVNGKTGEVKLTSEDVGAISQGDLQKATNEALAQAKESGEFDGKDGATGPQGPKGDTGSDGKDGSNGVSATHSWNGTVLTITSASGTSSADLKGEQGIQGIQGIPGEKGDKGDTGAPGSQGEQGPAGPQGEVGPAGPQGETGKQGPAGPQGPEGPRGPQGDPGDDYVLTEADKAEIAELAAALVDVPEGGGNIGLTTELKTALINYYTHVMPNFDDQNGLAYINAILTALGAETRGEQEEPDDPVVPDEPEKTLTSISATYSGGDVTAGTAVSDLTGIVVTARYSDGTSEAVTGYTLSGTIAEGSNTITVSYGGMTTTFTVTGVAESGGEETGVSNETTWTNGVAYTFEPIANEYPDNASGAIKPYNNWARSPYLYCAGASTLRGVVKYTSAIFSGTKDNAFYDADKNYVAPANTFSFSALANAEVGTYVDVQIPENAAYFIISGGNGLLTGSNNSNHEPFIEYVPYE